MSWKTLPLQESERQRLRQFGNLVKRKAKMVNTFPLSSKVSSGGGVHALFAGPSGTGKTLVAAVLARDLNLPLFRIDLRDLSSKYIGETEKNLERVFQQAKRSKGVLFFDEADALFGKRTEVRDAHDRYANLEVAYLLERMESYSGLVILATSLKNALDEAFVRRLDFVFTFSNPRNSLRVM